MGQINMGVYSAPYPDKRMILKTVSTACYLQIHNRREKELRLLRYIGRHDPDMENTDA